MWSSNWVFNWWRENTSLGASIFSCFNISDECVIHVDEGVNKHSVTIWHSQGPHETRQVLRDGRRVAAWYTLIIRRLIGTFYFDEPVVTEESKFYILNTFLSQCYQNCLLMLLCNEMAPNLMIFKRFKNFRIAIFSIIVLSEEVGCAGQVYPVTFLRLTYFVRICIMKKAENRCTSLTPLKQNNFECFIQI